MILSWKYKLPSDYDLRSLFSDFIGINIKSGIDVKTTKYESSEIPNNYDVAKAIAPNGFSGYGNWDYANFWEDSEFDNNKAYARKYDKSIYGTVETSQVFQSKLAYTDNELCNAICVYSTAGVKPSIRPVWVDKLKQAEIQKQQDEIKKHEEERRKAENDLF